MAAASGGGHSLKGKEVLKNQLKICGFKNYNDVTELYLGERELKEAPDLSRFRMLMYLWLNNNKIEKLTFLKHNCCLRELYLNNNEIRNIEGALRHLHSLQILLLHNNQLKNLETTVKELKGLKFLQTLSCEFGNHLVKIPFDDPEDAIFVRAMKRSIKEFSTVNWDQVSTSEEKRVGTIPEKKPERLTIKFR